jgi:hypothetical protein
LPVSFPTTLQDLSRAGRCFQPRRVPCNTRAFNSAAPRTPARATTAGRHCRRSGHSRCRNRRTFHIE